MKKRRSTILLSAALIFLFSRPGLPSSLLTDPYQILHRHYEVVGGLEAVKNVRTLYAEGTIVHDSLEGTFRHWSKDPLEYRMEEDYGVFRQTTGDDGEQSWSLDANGKLLIQRDTATLERREIQRRLDLFENLDPASPVFRETYEGLHTVNGSTCYAVKRTNTINNDITWNFLSVESFYLLRSVTRQPDFEVTTDYSDFRWVDGVLYAFTEDSRIHPRDKRETLRIHKLIPNPPVDPARFAVPADGAADFVFPDSRSSVSLPFQFIENSIYVPVKIHCEMRIWMLDSGASMSVVDADYAAALNIEPEGGIKGHGFGENFNLQIVKLPSYQVAGVQIRSQRAYAYRGLAEGFYEPKIVGILGYDFLSRFVVRIDYANRMITLFDPRFFTYTGIGVVVDAPFKYKTFCLEATLDDTHTGLWSIDLGAFNTSIHHPFAEKNGLFGRRGMTRISRGMSGEYFEKTVAFETFQIGGLVLQKPKISIPLEKNVGAGSLGETAGNIGNSLLRHFVLYLDYPRQRIIFEKGRNFNRPFPQDKSGMLLAPSETGYPRIVYTAPGYPGAAAGFQHGDIILKINGIDALIFGGLNPIRNLLRKRSETHYQLEIRRNGDRLSLPLRLD